MYNQVTGPSDIPKATMNRKIPIRISYCHTLMLSLNMKPVVISTLAMNTIRVPYSIIVLLPIFSNTKNERDVAINSTKFIADGRKRANYPLAISFEIGSAYIATTFIPENC